jgi:putative endonuclease
MTKERILLGKKGEELALRHLKKMGYKTIERNYRCKFGEVDIVAKDGKTLSFVEVKCTRSSILNSPKESITRKKQHQISKVALDYIRRRRLAETEARFDVIAVQLSPLPERIELIKDAFELTGIY